MSASDVTFGIILEALRKTRRDGYKAGRTDGLETAATGVSLYSGETADLDAETFDLAEQLRERFLHEQALDQGDPHA